MYGSKEIPTKNLKKKNIETNLIKGEKEVQGTLKHNHGYVNFSVSGEDQKCLTEIFSFSVSD